MSRRGTKYPSDVLGWHNQIIVSQRRDQLGKVDCVNRLSSCRSSSAATSRRWSLPTIWTTSPFTARYAKDNRLLPRGFDKRGASAETAVRSRAVEDADFEGGGDTVRYRIPLGADERFAAVTVRLMSQTIGYRWAENLAPYDSPETARFTRYHRAYADRSAVPLAEVEARWKDPAPIPR